MSSASSVCLSPEVTFAARQFFRIKIKDDVRTVMERERRPKLQKKRIKLLEWV